MLMCDAAAKAKGSLDFSSGGIPLKVVKRGFLSTERNNLA
jgi:hypothetical protein